jgi:hypothetical protein
MKSTAIALKHTLIQSLPRHDFSDEIANMTTNISPNCRAAARTNSPAFAHHGSQPLALSHRRCLLSIF